MDTKALRQKILDLAIRGKLVPQDPNDEPASVLLEHIREQKKQMVKDGKLKPKDIKNDTIIFNGDDNLHYEKFQDGTVRCIEDEIPFEVPEGWEWARLGAVAEAVGDGDHQPPPQTATGIPFLVISNISNGELSFEDTRFVSHEYYKNLPETRKPRKGDLLFTVTGSYGIPVLVDTETEFCFQRHIAIIRPCLVTNCYLYLVLASSYAKSICDAKSTGTAQKTVGLATLREMLIPIAPYEESFQIFMQVQKALKLVKSISSDKENLLCLVEGTKAKILDLAIRGKLVPQDQNNEPASVLLERIRVEKEELLKQGKIKRDKNESVIFKGSDNSYYQDLPENWQFTSLKEITTPLTLNDGDWILSQNMADIGEVKLLQLGSIGNMVYIDKGFKYLTRDTFNELSCTEIFPGYLLINRIISDKMCCCIVPNIDGTIITTVDTCWIAPSKTSYDIKFLMYQFASPTFQKKVLLKTSGTTRRRISKNNLINIALLLPPLAEQKRIVEAIEKIFAALDDITNQVT